MALESHICNGHPPPAAGFSDLPLEVLDIIFRPLSFTDKRRFRQVSPAWKSALDHGRHYRHVEIPASDVPAPTDTRIGSFQNSLKSVAPFVERMTIVSQRRNNFSEPMAKGTLHLVSETEINLDSLFAIKDIFPQLTQLDFDGGCSRFTTLALFLPRSITQVRFKDFDFVDRLMEPLSLGCIPCAYYNVHVRGSYTMNVPENDDKGRNGLKKELLEVARKFYRPVMYTM
ncbi:hypothetical protein RvY_10917 [Ramazzottius varieornatus]|uniref:F-box domain-containing protein n=1 Tax=Ramazzottius varieornatus TaxID=947166 RepID=A0A1D1VM56_RAMVA|nr:hypothetical protein RvY_10917 [Ramazzottius varieornatus]